MPSALFADKMPPALHEDKLHDLAAGFYRICLGFHARPILRAAEAVGSSFLNLRSIAPRDVMINVIGDLASSPALP